MTFWMVSMDAYGMEWRSFGSTKQEAINAMKAKYYEFVRQQGGPGAFETHRTWLEVFDYFGPWVMKYKVGEAYLDDQDETPSGASPGGRMDWEP